VSSEVAERENDEDSPEQEARRRIALAQVRQYPDHALRTRAREVSEYDGTVSDLVERMTRLMRDARGIGLAAPQVGVLRRILVYQVTDEDPVVALVNPRIVSSSEELESAEEGCLSLGAASIVVPVERPTAVVVEAETPGGEPLRVEAEGLEARVVQHELDHLDGVLIIDRTTDEERRGALAKLRPKPGL
jgi:peptide deformylase